jgi:hypothetical protein
MLKAGYFGTEDGSWKLYCDGREEGAQPEGGDKIGIQYGAEIDLSITWAEIAAELVEADGRPDKLQHHYNSTLGLPFSIGRSSRRGSPSTRPSAGPTRTPASRRRAKGPAAVGVALVMTVDTQKDYFWFLIRGWGRLPLAADPPRPRRARSKSSKSSTSGPSGTTRATNTRPHAATWLRRSGSTPAAA